MIDSPSIIHIGLGKCGSTSLQRFLFTNSEILKRYGYVYPQPIDGFINHRILALWLLDQWKPLPGGARAAAFPQIKNVPCLPASPLEHLRQQVEGMQETMILSSEGLYPMAPDFLTRYFPRGETKIVIYVREQLSYLLSAYAQVVQSRKTSQSFAEFLNRNWTSLDYSSLVNAWSKVFGPSYVIPRIYDRDLLRDGDICKDFLDILEINESNDFVFPTAIESNPSIGGPLLMFKLLLNSISEWDEKILMLKTYRSLQACAATEKRFRTKLAISSEMVEEVSAKYSESNDALFKNHFPHLNGFPAKLPQERAGDERLTVEDFENICMFLQTYKDDEMEFKNDVIEVHYKKMKRVLLGV